LEPPGENAAGSSNGYRNGTSTRDLVTSTGRLEEIKVPRDRAGQFHTQAFERYSRYEPHIADGLMQMFVAGVSTRHPSEKSPKRSWESLEVDSAISRLNQTLTQQFDTWRQRPLQEPWRILYLDGVHFSIRHGDKADSTIILTADSAWIWKETKRCWRGARVPRRTKMDGRACSKTCVHEAPPRSTSS
jgi:putative transposase